AFRTGTGPAMDNGEGQDLRVGWRLLAAVLIHPVTILAGLEAIVRIVSGFCFLIDSWTPEGALANFALGFPALAGLVPLWVSTILPAARITREKGRFVLVSTGLMIGTVLDILLLRAAYAQGAMQFESPGVLDVWTFAGPIIVAPVNLVLLARARDRLFTPE